jgi:hypothetical protein
MIKGLLILLLTTAAFCSLTSEQDDRTDYEAWKK